MTGWYYSKMGLQQGPVPEDELLTKIRRGEIDGTNLVWKDGMAEWKPLSQVPELVPPEGPIPAERGATDPSWQQPGQGSAAAGGNIPLPQPPAYHGHYAAPQIPSHMTASIVSLVLWCVSIVIICFPVGLPCAIVALVYGTKVDSLRAQGNLVSAQAASGSAKVWMIVSYSLFALPVLGAIGFLVFFGIHAAGGFP